LSSHTRRTFLVNFVICSSKSKTNKLPVTENEGEQLLREVERGKKGKWSGAGRPIICSRIRIGRCKIDRQFAVGSFIIIGGTGALGPGEAGRGMTGRGENRRLNYCR
jgi:hypothetical protein